MNQLTIRWPRFHAWCALNEIPRCIEPGCRDGWCYITKSYSMFQYCCPSCNGGNPALRQEGGSPYTGDFFPADHSITLDAFLRGLFQFPSET